MVRLRTANTTHQTFTFFLVEHLKPYVDSEWPVSGNFGPKGSPEVIFSIIQKFNWPYIVVLICKTYKGNFCIEMVFEILPGCVAQ